MKRLIFHAWVFCAVVAGPACSSATRQGTANDGNTPLVHVDPNSPATNSNCTSGQQVDGMCLPAGVGDLAAVYRFIARDTGHCLTAQSDVGERVLTDRCRPGEEQLWYAWEAHGTLLLASKAGASCLAVAANGDTIQAACALDATQQWRLSTTGDGFTQLVASSTNVALQYGPYGRNQATASASLDGNQSAQKWVVQTQLVTACDLAMADTTRPSFDVSHYGAVGDGNTDDGPAVAAAVAAANQSPTGGIVQFDGQKTYRIASLGADSNATALFDLNRNVVAQGHGAMLLMKYPITPFLAAGAQSVAMCGFAVDYSPLPFTQGTVLAVDVNQNTFDLLVSDDYALPGFDAANVADNSSTWQFGISDTYGYVWIQTIKEIDAAHTKLRIVRVAIVPAQAGDMSQLVIGSAVVLPVMGIGHHGGPYFYIHNSNDVTIADVSAYAIPFFSTAIGQNQGPVTISHAELRPLPGSDRMMSGWRDGYHTKDNRGALTFDTIWVERNHDDAFNISINWQQVTQVISPTQIVINQPYGSPLPQTGDHVEIIDPATAALIGETQATAIDPQSNTITLADPVSGLAVGQTFGSLGNANPNTVVRNCTVVNTGLRLRSPVQFLQNRTSGGLSWIGYDAVIEGPIPRDIVLSGNYMGPHSYYVLSVSVDGTYPAPAPRLMQNITIEDNTFLYVIHASDTNGLTLTDNDFVTEYVYSWFDVANDAQVVVSGTEHDGLPFDITPKVGLGANMSSSDVHITP